MSVGTLMSLRLIITDARHGVILLNFKFKNTALKCVETKILYRCLLAHIMMINS